MWTVAEICRSYAENCCKYFNCSWTTRTSEGCKSCGNSRRVMANHGKWQKVLESSRNWPRLAASRGHLRKEAVRQVVLRHVQHRHTLLLHELIFTRGCAALGFGKLASGSVEHFPGAFISSEEMRQEILRHIHKTSWLLTTPCDKYAEQAGCSKSSFHEKAVLPNLCPFALVLP